MSKEDIEPKMRALAKVVRETLNGDGDDYAIVLVAYPRDGGGDDADADPYMYHYTNSEPNPTALLLSLLMTKVLLEDGEDDDFDDEDSGE